MKNLLVLLLLLATLQLSAKTPTNVRGVINNPQGYSVRLTFKSDLVSLQDVQLNVPVNSAGYFDIPLFLAAPKFLEVQYGNRSSVLYLEPGNQLEMIIDGINPETPALFVGDGSIHNEYLNQSHKLFQAYTENYLKKQMQTLNPDAFKIWLDELKIKKKMVYEGYAFRHSFSQTFDTYAQSDIDYWWASKLLTNAQNFMSLAANAAPYFSFLNEVQPQNDEALSNENYVQFIRSYKQLPNTLNITRHNFSGKSLTYLQAVNYFQLIENKQFKPYKYEIEIFLNSCTIPEYRNVIEDAYAKAGQLKSGEIAPNAPLLDADGTLVSLEKFRGKVVYLGFWATWCVACLNEMETSEYLKFQFQNQDVIFLYVSVDDDHERWLNFSRNRNMTNDNFLHAPGGFDSQFAEAYGVNGLPTYFLIGKDGRVIKSPAKRPSKKAIVDDIRAALNEF